MQPLNLSAARRSYHAGEHAPTTTINDLPTPQGSWKTNYDSKQRSYNAHLALGIATITGTILFGKAAGLLEFYNDIPERPADIESYK